MYEKFTYEHISQIFEKKGCKIITTKEDFIENKLTCKKKFKYFAVCGHEREIKFAHFNNDNVGLYCKSCVSKNKSENIKTKLNNSSYTIENDSYKYIYENIKDIFDIHKTFDGCTADLLIKPKNIIDNNWMLIQLKSATKYKINGNYTFSHTKGYSNYNVICIGIDENIFKTWIMNGSLINLFNNITITSKKSKYSSYFIEQKELCIQLEKNYFDNNFKKIKLENDLDLYQNKNEQICRIQRNKYCNFLSINYPELSNCKYDCIINNYKIQDKSGKLIINKRISFNLNHGINGKRHLPYSSGDNDFYWFSCTETTKFFVIPELELIKYNYIKTDNQEGKTSIILYPLNIEDSKNKLTYWAVDYLFDYENLDIEKLQKLLKND